MDKCFKKEFLSNIKETLKEVIEYCCIVGIPVFFLLLNFYAFDIEEYKDIVIVIDITCLVLFLIYIVFYDAYSNAKKKCSIKRR